MLCCVVTVKDTNGMFLRCHGEASLITTVRGKTGLTNFEARSYLFNPCLGLPDQLATGSGAPGLPSA